MFNKGYIGKSFRRQDTPLDTPMNIIKEAIFSKLESAKTEYGEIDYEAEGISEDGENTQGIVNWIEKHGDSAHGIGDNFDEDEDGAGDGDSDDGGGGADSGYTI